MTPASGIFPVSPSAAASQPQTADPELQFNLTFLLWRLLLSSQVKEDKKRGKNEEREGNNHRQKGRKNPPRSLPLQLIRSSFIIVTDASETWRFEVETCFLLLSFLFPVPPKTCRLCRSSKECALSSERRVHAGRAAGPRILPA